MSRSSKGLSGDQLRLIVRLDDGLSRDESLGVRVAALAADDITIAEELKQVGLVELVGGWNEVFWLRLTERGRMMRAATRTA